MEPTGVTVEENAGVTSTDGCQLFGDSPTENKSDRPMPGLPDYMQRERERIKDMYTKKKNMLDKWIGLDDTFRLIQRVIMAFTMTGAAIIGIVAGVEESPTLSFIAGGLAAFSALKEPLSKLLITDFTTKKRAKYMKVCKVIKECQDKMYLSNLQASEDGKISVEEVVKYQDLIKAMEDQLFNIEADRANVMVV